MLTPAFAQQFAEAWADAMNSQDFEKISGHYSDDVEITTQVISRQSTDRTTTIKGINRISAFWKNTFNSLPDLRFGMYEFFTSLNSLVIYYKASIDKRACEIFYFDENGKIIRSVAHFN